jgi:two-component system, OmpR family, alkaline phosphatase synthesis response regulator PhoP
MTNGESANIKSSNSAVDKIKIVIAEDDKFLSKVLSNKFRRINYEVFIASDGIEAGNKIRTELPDVVLLDLMMPNKSGFEILEEIKAEKQFKNLPIIVLSNLGQKNDIARSQKLGAADYLVKSNLSINAVVDKVKEILAAAGR